MSEDAPRELTEEEIAALSDEELEAAGQIGPTSSPTNGAAEEPTPATPAAPETSAMDAAELAELEELIEAHGKDAPMTMARRSLEVSERLVVLIEQLVDELRLTRTTMVDAVGRLSPATPPDLAPAPAPAPKRNGARRKS